MCLSYILLEGKTWPQMNTSVFVLLIHSSSFVCPFCGNSLVISGPTCTDKYNLNVVLSVFRKCFLNSVEVPDTIMIMISKIFKLIEFFLQHRQEGSAVAVFLCMCAPLGNLLRLTSLKASQQPSGDFKTFLFTWDEFQAVTTRWKFLNSCVNFGPQWHEANFSLLQEIAK